MLFLLTIGQHDDVTFKFTILLNRFQKLYKGIQIRDYVFIVTYSIKGDLELWEDVKLKVLLGGYLVK